MPDPNEPGGDMTEHPSGSGAKERESASDPEVGARHAEYWQRNIRYMGILLAIWFVVSFGFGILLVEPLNTIRIPGTGFPLGFWFAQQGAIYVFVVLIFVYVRLMNRLDREFGVDEGEGA